MRIEILDPDEGWRLIRSLEAEVYPPQVLAHAPWRDVVWAHADRRVVAWADGEARPGAHVGMYLRDGEVDGRPACIGGVGGVMTRPDLRGQGLASAAVREAARWLAEEAAAGIALLFCEPHLEDFYRRLGWRRFAGRTVVFQPPGRAPFSHGVNPMIQPLAGPEPTHLIDLKGLPWSETRLLPLREKVAAEGRRMRGRAPISTSREPKRCRPTRQGFRPLIRPLRVHLRPQGEKDSTSRHATHGWPSSAHINPLNTAASSRSGFRLIS